MNSLEIRVSNTSQLCPKGDYSGTSSEAMWRADQVAGILTSLWESQWQHQHK